MKRFFLLQILLLSTTFFVAAKEKITLYYETKGGQGSVNWFNENLWKDVRQEPNRGLTLSNIPITEPKTSLSNKTQLLCSKKFSSTYDVTVYITINSGDRVYMQGKQSNSNSNVVIYNLQVQNKVNIDIQKFADLEVQDFMITTKFPSLNINGNLYVHGVFSKLSSKNNVNIGSSGYLGVEEWVKIYSEKNLNNDGAIASKEKNKKCIKGNTKKIAGVGEEYFEVTYSVIPRPDFLPIKLKSFTAIVKNNIAYFHWVTATEENNDFFTIEQSANLTNWEEVYLTSGAGNSSVETAYNAQVNLNAKGIYYFRLKQTDYDGRYTYSQVVSVNNNQLPDRLIPKAKVINGNLIVDNKYELLQIYTMQGRLLETYSNEYIINDFKEKGMFILVFDNKHKQKICIN